jgi:hypothetical protein
VWQGGRNHEHSHNDKQASQQGKTHPPIGKESSDVQEWHREYNSKEKQAEEHDFLDAGDRKCPKRTLLQICLQDPIHPEVVKHCIRVGRNRSRLLLPQEHRSRAIDAIMRLVRHQEGVARHPLVVERHGGGRREQYQ